MHGLTHLRKAMLQAIIHTADLSHLSVLRCPFASFPDLLQTVEN